MIVEDAQIKEMFSTCYTIWENNVAMNTSLDMLKKVSRK